MATDGRPAGPVGGGLNGAAPGSAAPARPVFVVGAHGGAGASTLAWLLAPAVDVGPARDWRGLANPSRYPVVLVTGCTAAATGRAAAEFDAAARVGTVPRVLVVVNDGWPIPRAARARLRLLEPRVTAVVRVPFVPNWRYVDRPDRARLPRGIRMALAEIRDAADKQTP